MTRKDYIALAAALRASQPNGALHNDTMGNEAAKRAASVAWAVWRGACQSVADTLAGDNSRFNRSRFYAACGLEV